ncbi:riboflavin kinase [Serendipita vermifera]|nr:riboflavin kinase [Serendipita vermifera]
MDNAAQDQDQRPDAPMRTDTFRRTRPTIVGGESPESPFPAVMSGQVQHGFKRGSRELGCHTANLPDEALERLDSRIKTGIYFGYAQVRPECPNGTASSLPSDDYLVYPMVMSIGWNPFYKNEKMTAEVHIIHKFANDFYGHEMTVVVLGYIRPELDYTSKEALIEDIQFDIKVALNSLEKPQYKVFSQDAAFRL